MIDRPVWMARLRAAWQRAPIAWLAGVRRSGKTTLAQAISGTDALYVNCDLPVSEDRLSDPERFFRECGASLVVFDEIHQLRDPSRVLKIGADLFPKLRILATGSSTLAASRKFRDTLTGRKRVVHLVPVLGVELHAFGDLSVERRLLHGGLPPALLSTSRDPSFYREWMDSFFARDIHRLFAFRDMNRFNAFFDYVLRQSGGQFSATHAANTLGVARPTVESHLRALEITHAAVVLRPHAGSGSGELSRQPKVYGFDTGFVAFARGWDTLRTDDCGPLWEHVVLEHVLAHFPDLAVRYWRDKQGHEVDFVLPHARDRIDAIECKWSVRNFQSTGLRAFRQRHPLGRNFVVAPLSGAPYSRTVDGIEVTFTGLEHLT